MTRAEKTIAVKNPQRLQSGANTFLNTDSQCAQSFREAIRYIPGGRPRRTSTCDPPPPLPAAGRLSRALKLVSSMRKGNDEDRPRHGEW